MLIMVLEALASSIVHAGNNWGYGEAAVVADAWFMWRIQRVLEVISPAEPDSTVGPYDFHGFT